MRVTPHLRRFALGLSGRRRSRRSRRARRRAAARSSCAASSCDRVARRGGGGETLLPFFPSAGRTAAGRGTEAARRAARCPKAAERWGFVGASKRSAAMGGGFHRRWRTRRITASRRWRLLPELLCSRLAPERRNAARTQGPTGRPSARRRPAGEARARTALGSCRSPSKGARASPGAAVARARFALDTPRAWPGQSASVDARPCDGASRRGAQAGSTSRARARSS